MRPLGTGTLRIDVGEITRDLAITIERALEDYPDHSVELRIDSNGGCWNASHVIFDRLTNHPHLVTANISKAQSGGALIALAADRRVMSPHGTFFLHWPKGQFSQAYLDEVAATKAALIASRCRVPSDTLLRWMKNNTTIAAERALAIGLATEVPGMKSPTTPTVFLT